MRRSGRAFEEAKCTSQLGLEFLERAGATPGEIERIMWRNAADLYKLPYDEPAASTVAA